MPTLAFAEQVASAQYKVSGLRRKRSHPSSQLTDSAQHGSESSKVEELPNDPQPQFDGTAGKAIDLVQSSTVSNTVESVTGTISCAGTLAAAFQPASENANLQRFKWQQSRSPLSSIGGMVAQPAACTHAGPIRAATSLTLQPQQQLLHLQQHKQWRQQQGQQRIIAAKQMLVESEMTPLNCHDQQLKEPQTPGRPQLYAWTASKLPGIVAGEVQAPSLSCSSGQGPPPAVEQHQLQRSQLNVQHQCKGPQAFQWPPRAHQQLAVVDELRKQHFLQGPQNEYHALQNQQIQLARQQSHVLQAQQQSWCDHAAQQQPVQQQQQQQLRPAQQGELLRCHQQPLQLHCPLEHQHKRVQHDSERLQQPKNMLQTLKAQAALKQLDIQARFCNQLQREMRQQPLARQLSPTTAESPPGWTLPQTSSPRTKLQGSSGMQPLPGLCSGPQHVVEARPVPRLLVHGVPGWQGPAAPAQQGLTGVCNAPDVGCSGAQVRQPPQSQVPPGALVVPLHTLPVQPAHAQAGVQLQQGQQSPQAPTGIAAATKRLRQELPNWIPHEGVVAAYAAKGITQLYPWQAGALESGEDGSNLVYCAPTSGGKSIVADLLMIRRLLSRRTTAAAAAAKRHSHGPAPSVLPQRALLVLPYLSIVAEKAAHLEGLLQPMKARVQGYMGVSETGTPLSARDEAVSICTMEKANVAINKLIEEKRLGELCCVVVDEVHMVSDRHRGQALELCLTKLMYCCASEGCDIQVVCMSATIAGLDTMCDWLNARLFITNYRPVPLTEHAVFGGRVFSKMSVTEFAAANAAAAAGGSTAGAEPLVQVRQLEEGSRGDRDRVLALIAEVMRDGHSTLVFCSSRRACQSCAKLAAQHLPAMLGPVTQEVALQRQELAISLTDAMAGHCNAALQALFVAGVAYHHAGMTSQERSVVEHGFRSGALLVLMATSTLAAGINLPARRVVLRTLQQGIGPVSRAQYLQMIGRAGRAGHSAVGESFIIGSGQARAPGEWDAICKLMTAPLPRLTSQLLDPMAPAAAGASCGAGRQGNPAASANAGGIQGGSHDRALGSWALGSCAPSALPLTGGLAVPPPPGAPGPAVPPATGPTIQAAAAVMGAAGAMAVMQGMLPSAETRTPVVPRGPAAPASGGDLEAQPGLQRLLLEAVASGAARTPEGILLLLRSTLAYRQVEMACLGAAAKAAINALALKKLVSWSPSAPYTLQDAPAAMQGQQCPTPPQPAQLLDHATAQQPGQQAQQEQQRRLQSAKGEEWAKTAASGAVELPAATQQAGKGLVPAEAQGQWETRPMGRSVYDSSLSTASAIAMHRRLDKLRGNMVMSASSLHLIYHLLGDHPFSIHSWTVWLRLFESLPRPAQLVAEAEGVDVKYITQMVGGRASVKAIDELHNRLAAAWALNAMVCEGDLVDIEDAYGKPEELTQQGVTRGQMQRLQGDVAKMAGMCALLCASAGWWQLEMLLTSLSQQAAAGARAELLPLMEVHGMTGARARGLYDRGIKTPEALAAADEADVHRAVAAALPRNLKSGIAAGRFAARAAVPSKPLTFGLTGSVGANAMVYRATRSLVESARTHMAQQLQLPAAGTPAPSASALTDSQLHSGFPTQPWDSAITAPATMHGAASVTIVRPSTPAELRDALLSSWSRQTAFAFSLAVLPSGDRDEEGAIISRAAEAGQAPNLPEGAGTPAGVVGCTRGRAADTPGTGAGQLYAIAICWDHREILVFELPTPSYSGPSHNGGKGEAPALSGTISKRKHAGSGTGKTGSAASGVSAITGITAADADVRLQLQADAVYQRAVWHTLRTIFATPRVTKWCFALEPQLAVLAWHAVMPAPSSIRDTQLAFWLLHYPQEYSGIGLAAMQKAVLPQYRVRVPLQARRCVTQACRSAAVSWMAAEPLCALLVRHSLLQHFCRVEVPLAAARAMGAATACHPDGAAPAPAPRAAIWCSRDGAAPSDEVSALYQGQGVVIDYPRLRHLELWCSALASELLQQLCMLAQQKLSLDTPGGFAWACQVLDVQASVPKDLQKETSVQIAQLQPALLSGPFVPPLSFSPRRGLPADALANAQRSAALLQQREHLIHFRKRVGRLLRHAPAAAAPSGPVPAPVLGLQMSGPEGTLALAPAARELLKPLLVPTPCSVQGIASLAQELAAGALDPCKLAGQPVVFISQQHATSLTMPAGAPGYGVVLAMSAGAAPTAARQPVDADAADTAMPASHAAGGAAADVPHVLIACQAAWFEDPQQLLVSCHQAWRFSVGTGRAAEAVATLPAATAGLGRIGDMCLGHWWHSLVVPHSLTSCLVPAANPWRSSASHGGEGDGAGGGSHVGEPGVFVRCSLPHLSLAVLAHCSEDEGLRAAAHAPQPWTDLVERWLQQGGAGSASLRAILQRTRLWARLPPEQMVRVLVEHLVLAKGPKWLAARLGVARDIARALVQSFNACFAGLAMYRSRLLETAQKGSGHVLTLVGRRLPLDTAAMRRSISEGVVARQQIRAHGMQLQCSVAEAMRSAMALALMAAQGACNTNVATGIEACVQDRAWGGAQVGARFGNGLAGATHGGAVAAHCEGGSVKPSLHAAVAAGTAECTAGERGPDLASGRSAAGEPTARPAKRPRLLLGTHATGGGVTHPGYVCGGCLLVACSSHDFVLRVPKAKVAEAVAAVHMAAAQQLPRYLGLAVPLVPVVLCAGTLDPLDGWLQPAISC